MSASGMCDNNYEACTLETVVTDVPLLGQGGVRGGLTRYLRKSFDSFNPVNPDSDNG